MSEQVITKRCAYCKQIKPISEKRKIAIKKYKQSEKGKISKKKYWLSENGKQVARKYRASKKGQETQKQYRQTEKVKQQISLNYKRYCLKYPQRTKARGIVEYAVRTNKIPSAQKLLCQCGKNAKEYHHFLGYEPEHWLDIIPVCQQCHSKSHSKFPLRIT